jgi:hypothetical protein
MPYLIGYYVFMIAAWFAAWYLHDLTFVSGLGPGAKVAYWTVAKLIVWIAPLLLIIRCVLKRPAVAYLGLTGFARGARVGSAIGATFVLLSAIVDVFTRTHARPGPSWGLLSVLTVAPLFEEVMFRGFALKTLEDSGYPLLAGQHDRRDPLSRAAPARLALHGHTWCVSGRRRPERRHHRNGRRIRQAPLELDLGERDRPLPQQSVLGVRALTIRTGVSSAWAQWRAAGHDIPWPRRQQRPARPRRS